MHKKCAAYLQHCGVGCQEAPGDAACSQATQMSLGLRCLGRCRLLLMARQIHLFSEVTHKAGLSSPPGLSAAALAAMPGLGPYPQPTPRAARSS